MEHQSVLTTVLLARSSARIRRKGYICRRSPVRLLICIKLFTKYRFGARHTPSITAGFHPAIPYDSGRLQGPVCYWCMSCLRQRSAAAQLMLPPFGLSSKSPQLVIMWGIYVAEMAYGRAAHTVFALQVGGSPADVSLPRRWRV